MKKAIFTVAIALMSLVSCKKEDIKPNVKNNYSILNDEYEGEWTINTTYYYDSLDNYVQSNVTGTINITDTTFSIDTDFYEQDGAYMVESNSSDSVVYMNVSGYGIGSGEGAYSMKNNTTETSLILIIPTEPGASNNAYKLIKASR